MIWLWLLLLLIAIFVILEYNKLVSLRVRAKNAWSKIDIQLKRRYNLIPNLVETVKGYAKHERETFELVTQARNLMQNAKTVKEKAKANSQLAGALKSLFAVVENYPTLKANENFKMLQEELEGTENKIAYARQFYNDAVMMLNTAIQKFPTNMIASMFHFKEMDMFEASSEDKKVPKVKF